MTRPDGSTTDLVPGTAGATAVTYSGTQSLGVYAATPLGLTGTGPAPFASGPPASGSAASPAPSGGAASPAASASSAAASPQESPRGSPAGSPGGSPAGTRPPVDPNAPVRFAVNLFDVGESTIAPGSAATIEALGTGGPAASAPPASAGASASTPPSASPSVVPSPSSATGASAVGRPPARDELWTVIVLAALALLLLEYAVYQRDTLARWRRALASRLVGIRPASRGSHGGGSRPTVGRPTQRERR
ncbi:MAG: hypothetical protein E6I94_06475 [Chloroflexi bacterium]|nr:MAG: hypothetical protein E6I94_06475 [Chloroflexota bacterium]